MTITLKNVDKFTTLSLRESALADSWQSFIFRKKKIIKYKGNLDYENFYA